MPGIVLFTPVRVFGRVMLLLFSGAQGWDSGGGTQAGAGEGFQDVQRGEIPVRPQVGCFIFVDV